LRKKKKKRKKKEKKKKRRKEKRKEIKGQKKKKRKIHQYQLESFACNARARVKRKISYVVGRGSRVKLSNYRLKVTKERKTIKLE